MTDETPTTPQSYVKEHWQIGVTLVLLAGFGLLAWRLFASADGATEIVWQRRVYVLSGVEALVFTAVGWLFGREVSRAATESARQDAAAAKQEAQTARDEAQQQTAEAADAKVEAAAEAAKAKAAATVVKHTDEAAGRAAAPAAGSRDAGLGDGPGRPAAGTAVDLKALFRDLYP